ncbi:MAG TPA: ATP-binding cassette domain-containing protein [Candidatus Sulfotelmatobacter sp.]|jgi:ATP-binding cassette subfamily B protein/ATP-binding cassette subfamily C protein LapB|nr:ATP-binding cassette domain-containing protein [Candidatus Sulfotelmatobacter sp.]
MTETKGLPLDQALAAVLAGLGRPPALIEGNPAENPSAFLGDILSPLGVQVSLMRMPARKSDKDFALPELLGMAALVELADGGWLPLVARPGDAPPEVAGADGGLALLPTPLPALSGRAYDLRDMPEAELNVEVRGFLRRNWRYMFPIIVGGVISNLLNLVIPLFGSFVYDKVLGNGVSDTLWAMVLGVLLGVGLDFCTRALRIQLVERMAVTSEGDIDRALFRGLLLRPGALPPVGVVLDKYKQMLSSRDFVSSSYLLAASDLPFLLLYLFCILLVGGPMVLVPIFWGGMTMLLNAIMTTPARQYDRQARRAGEERVGILADLLMAREAVVTSRWSDELGRRWRRASDNAAVSAGRTRFWNSLVGAVASWSNSLSYASVMVVGAYMVEDHLLTSGGMMAASMLTSRCLIIVSSVALLSTRFREFRRALREMDAMIPAGKGDDGMVRPVNPTGDIHIQGVTWKPRSDSRPILQGLELRVHPGEIIGIAGLPGAGKTTLMRLVCGVELPSEGRVLLDMLPVDMWSQQQRAHAIGYKTQDAVLFDGTLETNIRAGNNGASLDDLRRAIDMAGLRPAFERGEMTLGTQVGPRGSFLSGGQRQMVALARAFLGDPAILLLDEPSTGFDSQAEINLAQRLAGLAGQRTILISSHSRPLLSICSRIIVLQGGRIVADGPREKILIN